MLRVLAVLVLLFQTASAGLEKYADLVVADPTPSRPVPPQGVRITYLGVNGYKFETGGRTLLVDPYFTRVGLGAIALNAGIETDEKQLDAVLPMLGARIDAVLVTHAHFDHFMDVPTILRRTGTRLIAGRTAVNIARSFDIPAAQCSAVQKHATRRIGPWTNRVLAAKHDRIIGPEPSFPGERPSPPSRRPVRATDWVLGEPLAFVIEAAGQRIYLDSGGAPDLLPPADLGRIDLAIVGVALWDSRARLGPALRRLKPRFVLPSHQDNFFLPLERGFSFSQASDFPRVRRIVEAERPPGSLILLDYFRPWTLR